MNPVSLYKKMMFSQMGGLVRLARHKVLQAEDMPPLPAHLSPRHLPLNETRINSSSANALLHSLAREAWPFLGPALLLHFVYAGLNLTKPVLVNAFVTRIAAGFASPGSLPLALVLAGTLGLVSFLASLTLQHYFQRVLGVNQILMNVVNRLIFRHSLMLTQRARGETQLGDVVNHLGTDTDALAESGQVAGDLSASILTILGGAALLFWYLGITAFLSVGLLLLMLPLSRQVARSFSKLDDELMKFRDQRVTLMSQILNGIRVVKYFAWEKSMREEVAGVREHELRARRRLAQAEAVATLSYVAISTLVLFASLGLHAYRGFALTPALVFTIVAVFTILEDPLGHLSESISRLAAARVAAGRISAFLRRERLSAPGTEEEGLPGLLAHNLRVHFPGAGAPALDSLSFELSPGESLAVVGPVGAGKSTLLQAILQELPLATGSLSVVNEHRKALNPCLAYVPQEAFIVNGSLEENIQFGSSVADADAMAEALRASCLDTDLPQLPAGLFTEIGEKGVNLSGGQKQRVSLARAVLKRPSLVLLDDPLSAVDTRTEDQLVQRLLFGAWQNITRVVVTHRLAHLHRFDKVLYLVDGKMRGWGTPAEVGADPQFQAFLNAALAGHGQAMGLAKEPGPAVGAKPAASQSRVTEDEERAVGAVRGRVYLDYLKALGGTSLPRRLVCLSLLLGSAVVASLLPLLQKSWLAYTADTQSGQLAQDSWLREFAIDSRTAIFVYGGLGILTLAGVLANRLFWLQRGMAAGRQFHDRMLRSVLHAPLRFFDSTPVGRVLQRFSRDVEAVDIHLQWSFEITVRCLVNIGTALALILGLLPLMVVVIAPVLALYYIVQRDYRIPAREVKRLDAISRSPRYAHFKETLQGLVVIRSFGRTENFFEGFLQRLEFNQRMFYGHYMLNRWFSSRVPLLGGMVASATALGIVYYTYRGGISAGVAGLLVVYALTLWESLNWAVRIYAEVEAKMTSVERLRYYGSLDSERETAAPAASLPANWPTRGELAFTNVVARYADHLPPVLKGISFTVPAGARVGIIGRTGSGKSTLLQVLYRCMELEAGQIHLDGVDIAAVPLPTLRRSLAIIPQDPTLFLGTLRRNVDRFGEYSDHELWAALAQARLEEFVRRLPGGLDAVVLENGSNLSQGQRQLLCLARALLCQARVIVMDEATASVDGQTDELVQEVVRESCRGVTLLVIAHRLGTVADCDFVLEVREGLIHRIINPMGPPTGTPGGHHRRSPLENS